MTESSNDPGAERKGKKKKIFFTQFLCVTLNYDTQSSLHVLNGSQHPSSLDQEPSTPNQLPRRSGGGIIIIICTIAMVVRSCDQIDGGYGILVGYIGRLPQTVGRALTLKECQAGRTLSGRGTSVG